MNEEKQSSTGIGSAQQGQEESLVGGGKRQAKEISKFRQKIALGEQERITFLSLIKTGQPHECWLWTGSGADKGYGRFWCGGKHLAATRIAFYISHGEMPTDKGVYQTCRNRLCLNPAHLEVRHSVMQAKFGRSVNLLPSRDDPVFRLNGLYSPPVTMGEYVKHFSMPILETGCWVWIKKSQVRGYGVGVVGGLSVLSHRLSYHAFVGDLTDDLLVCHKCDNRACVNPEHLFLGTYADNSADASAKKRLGKIRNREGELVALLRSGLNHCEISRRTGIERSSVWKLARKFNITARKGSLSHYRASSNPNASPLGVRGNP